MGDKINDGGCAFPCEQGHTPDGTWNQTFEPGMSLRDYVAAKAMAAYIAAHSGPNQYLPDCETIAAYAFGCADAFMDWRSARTRHPEDQQ